MERLISTPRSGRGRGRGRGQGLAASSRSARHIATSAPSTEPPPKKRKYIPGGPGGGGRFVDEDGNEVPAAPSTAPRPRAPSRKQSGMTSTPAPARAPSTRIRTAVNRDTPEELQISSAAAVAAAAAAVQNEGYKPREERGWEEFHPNLDIEATIMVYNAEDVDGVSQPVQTAQKAETSVNGAGTPINEGENIPTAAPSLTDTPSKPQGKPNFDAGAVSTPPPRRRPGRPPRDHSSFYGIQANGMTPKTPKVLPIHNQNPKERLDLKQASYRRTDRIALFESKTFGQARYVDKSMMNVGYQESDNYIRPVHDLIKASDANVDEELEPSFALKPEGDTAASTVQNPAGAVGRVEYDMDEQDDMWLEKLNAQRKTADLGPITREMFEITITKIEKCWHALEKRIPKPNPKPPQTHRPRSSSAAAVNGEPQAGEEQDSKCAICDDGDCENTNAIVFCDGCDLAVHQECYGVPFIPEGQWLCRKCQLIGRGIPTCIFCPNTDGAFKQTNSSKWAHLLCAMWIPEVSLGNHTFMEPVMEVEKVPKNRWRLNCYICDQKMGACIQCSNKNCYQAFHVTCARRCRLFLKMKNSQGALAILDGPADLRAFCDQHCPADYAKENDVALATKQAKKFYKRAMKGRIWADSQAAALQLAATHRNAITEHPPDESQMTGAKMSAMQADSKKKGQPAKPIWKLPSGAPIIPLAVYEAVESSLQRFTIRQRKDFVAEACRYWTLKREARRGAALLKRLQLQMETFSSMELTRRNFAAMGASGKARLTRRIEFAEVLMKDLEQLKTLSETIVAREADKLEAAQLEEDFVDNVYFPLHRMLLAVTEKALQLDKFVFIEGLSSLQDKLEQRFYTTTMAFTHALCETIQEGINAPSLEQADVPRLESSETSPTTPGNNQSEIKDRRRLGKRILKSVQKLLQAAVQAEAELTNGPVDVQALFDELDRMIDSSLELKQPAVPVTNAEMLEDEPMPDAPQDGQIVVVHSRQGNSTTYQEDAPVADGDIKEEAGTDADEDAMNIDTVPPVADGPDDSSAPAAPVTEQSEDFNSLTATLDRAVTSAASKPSGITQTSSPPHSHVADANSPPTAAPQPQSQPLTPPRSLTNGNPNAPDALNEGGVPWYLHDLDIEGTTLGEDLVAATLSDEELSEMDDETLNDLGFDVNDSTISVADVPVKKGRPNPANFRKGTRSSARRR